MDRHIPSNCFLIFSKYNHVWIYVQLLWSYVNTWNVCLSKGPSGNLWLCRIKPRFDVAFIISIRRPDTLYYHNMEESTIVSYSANQGYEVTTMLFMDKIKLCGCVKVRPVMAHASLLAYKITCKMMLMKWETWDLRFLYVTHERNKSCRDTHSAPGYRNWP